MMKFARGIVCPNPACRDLPGYDAMIESGYHAECPNCRQLNRVAGGERSGVELSTERAQAARVTALAGARQQYLVRARACDGPTGAWVWGPAFALGIVPDTSPRLVAGHNWSESALPGAQGGTVRFAVARGATMSFTFTGRAVSWIAPRRPSDGEAVVALGDAPDPATGQRQRVLPHAAEVIDLLLLLRAKTEGNRTVEESQILDELLYDLQLRYVRATKSA